MSSNLVIHLARFSTALRSRGIAVGIGDEVDATRGLTLIDLGDREEVRRALLATLKIRPRDREVFEEVFNQYWSLADTAVPEPRQQARTRGNLVVGRRSPAYLARNVEGEAETPGGETAAYSPEIALRRKPFEKCSAKDLADMEQLLARWVPRWAARRSRRLTPVKSRGVFDIRRSFRRALATGGEMLWVARRGRATDEPQLVVLCDTSGSMDVHVRFLLAFVLALRKLARRTEVFAFNTSLTRLTPWLTPGKIGHTLDRLAASVPDWSGGTRIGESLTEFASKYGTELTGARSVVVIMSDGLDRGDTTLVAAAMRAIRSRVRRVIWLNPLAGDPRFEPTARAMHAAMPFIDRFGPAHNLESLERLLPELAA
jgi:uncharacterized protein with von Willebrand factor type A (vWA) domain